MDLEQKIDAVVQAAIAENRIVGSVLIVRHKGKLVYEKAAGLADREAGRPMTLDAIFRLSSLTKPIVAATILALADSGKLQLDDPITLHFPAFQPKLAAAFSTTARARSSWRCRSRNSTGSAPALMARSSIAFSIEKTFM